MKITSPKLHTSHLTVNEEALVRCQTALRAEGQGEYFGRHEAMRSFLETSGANAETSKLYPSVAAEVLLCAAY